MECAIEGVDLKGKQIKRQRQVWCGAVQFDDGQPANDWEHGVYFKVSFTPEQLAQANVQNPGKNIYVPVNDQGSGGVVETFPAALLSTDRAQAGVVRIPKPFFLRSR